MNDAEFQLQALGDPRLGDTATSALPAWLWSADGARILWANPVGAQAFGAANGLLLAKRAFGPADPHRRQVARLGRNLAADGAVRLERLPGFGAPAGSLATCACARLDLPDGSHGILISTLNAIGRTMPLVERLQRLVQGLERPVVAFASDGLFIGANDAARSLPGLHTLSDAGLDAARTDALTQGRAAADVAIGRVVLHRVGRGADVGLIAVIKPAVARATNTWAAAPATPDVATPEPVAQPAAVATEPPAAATIAEPDAKDDAPPPTTDAAPAGFTLFDALDPAEDVAPIPQHAAAPEPADREPAPAAPALAELAVEPSLADALMTTEASADTHEPEPDFKAFPTEAAHPQVLPVEVLPVEVLPIEVLPTEVLPTEPFAVATTEAESTPVEPVHTELKVEPALADAPMGTDTPEIETPPHEPSPYIEPVADEPADATAETFADVAAPDQIADAPTPAAEQPSAEPAPVSAPAAAPPPWLDDPVPDTRRHPLRFMWQMDHEGRFSLGSDEFTRLIGMHTAAGFGRLWSDIADTFALDPEGRVMTAFATHDTWSGIVLHWPVDGGGRLPVELSGLPVFDRHRNFAGYRGFGVCRDLDGLARLAALRRYEFFSGPPVPQSPPAAEALPPAEAPPPPESNAAPPPEEPTEPITSNPSHQADLDRAVETTQDMRDDTPQNVVPFRPAGDARPPSLTPVENNAFNELARQLSARLESEAGLTSSTAEGNAGETVAELLAEPPHEDAPASRQAEWLAEPAPPPRGESRRDKTLLDLLPVGILIYRLDRLLYANHAFLERMGYDSLHALEDAGGLDALYVEPGVSNASSTSGSGTPVTISANQAGGEATSASADARLHTISWDNDSALALIFTSTRHEDAAIADALSATDAPAAAAPVPAPPEAGHADAEELGAILDTAAEGIIMFDAEGKISSCNRSAEALFGYDGDALIKHNLAELFAPESQRDIFDYLAGLKSPGVASLLDHGREALGRVRQGGIIPLSVTMGRTRADGPNFFAVFRDLSQARKGESELREARRLVERAANAKTDMLARISHELRTPLNAIIGFAEVMITERFGALGNERYAEYMKDIRASGERVIAIVNDLLDLSRIETGKLDLAFTSQNLNEMVESCVAVMQPQANRERIIIRTSLAHTLPPVVADARALRQITLNLIGNSIHLANTGGQVIVSTALSDFGEVMLRVRDTGQSLNDNEVAAALEPFRAPAPSDHAGAGGVSLSLTKALVEANRAKFQIKTGGRSGTLIEVVFSHAAVRA